MTEKTVKIIAKEGNEVFPQSIPMSNIFDTNGVNLEERLGSINDVQPSYSEGITVATISGKEIKVPYVSGTQVISGTVFFDSFLAMTSSTRSFAEGEILETKGYYQFNDGGQGRYIVVSSSQSGEALTDGHKAQLMIPTSGVINFRQLGGKAFNQDSTFDCKATLEKYLESYSEYTLFIPGGLWCFSETTITGQCSIIGENSQASLLPGKTTIAPISNSSQNFLWKCTGENVRLSNLMFIRQQYGVSNITQMGSGGAAYKTPTCPKTLLIEGVENGYFDGIYFSFASNCLDISNTKNTYVGYLNIRQSGGSVDGVRSVIRLGDNIEGLYFDYLNAEVISGNVFYGYGSDSESPCQFIMNDLQMEATHATTSNNISDPGYDHNIGHWFIFNGKLGSKERPCILHSASVSNLKSFHQFNNVNYKTMALFGHETSVPMGFIVGNVFVGGVKSTGPWYIYDTSQGASFTFNQPVLSSDAPFYLKNASMPLLQSSNKKPNIMQGALATPTKVSYKSGAMSSHSLTGTNDLNEYYTLYALNGSHLKIRFYNESGISSFTATIEKEVSGEWSGQEFTRTVTCSGEVGWESVIINNLGSSSPVRVRIKGLPKYIDYFTEYEDI